MEGRRKKGRPPMAPEKKRRPVNLTFSPAVLKMAESSFSRFGVSSLSELVEIALNKLIKSDSQQSTPIIQFRDGAPSAPIARKVVALSFYGHIAAGNPGGPIDVAEDEIVIPGEFDRSTHFVLRVNGESMEPQYPDRSLIVCRRLRTGEFAKKGDDVVSADSSGSYFKRLEYTKDGKKGNGPRKATPHLISLNPDYPEVVPVSDQPIIAVVVAKVDE
jgi:SOS-response transcriptional repressor LexA